MRLSVRFGEEYESDGTENYVLREDYVILGIFTSEERALQSASKRARHGYAPLYLEVWRPNGTCCIKLYWVLP